MSIQALAWVLEHSEAEGSGRLVLIALANHADSDGGRAFPSVGTLAREARLSERTVQYALRKLAGDGHIEQTGITKSGTFIYAIRLRTGGVQSSAQGVQDLHPGDAQIAPGGCKVRQVGVQPVAPEPSLTVNEPPSPAYAGERARGALRVGGRPVKAEGWLLTQQILQEFNRQTGRDLRGVTSGGKMSEAARLIYGRVCEYADLRLEDYRRIIANTIESRWWWHGAAQGERATPNVVFGPRIFEANISRKSGGPVLSFSREEPTAGRSKAERLRDDMEALKRLEGVA